MSISAASPGWTPERWPSLSISISAGNVVNNEFVTGHDGRPRLVQREHVNIALAVDVDKGWWRAHARHPMIVTRTRWTSPASSVPTRT